MLRKDSEDWDEIVGGFYEAAVNPEQWRSVLDAFARATNGRGAIMAGHPFGTPETIWSPALDEGIDDYISEWHRLERRSERIANKPRGRIYCDMDLFTHEELQSDPFYNEFLAPLDFFWCAGTLLTADFGGGRNSQFGFSIQRSHTQDCFSKSELEILGRVVPHLSRAVQLAAGVSALQENAASTALSAAGIPALLLDASGRLVEANAAAQPYLGRELLVRHERAYLQDNRANASLMSAIKAAACWSVSQPLPPLVCVPREGDMPLLLSVFPMAGADQAFRRARVCVMIRDASGDRPSVTDTLRATFRLSPAEARAVHGICQGKTVSDVSDEFQVSRETVRTQLKLAFDKMGVSRQIDAVRLVYTLGNSSGHPPAGG